MPARPIRFLFRLFLGLSVAFLLWATWYGYKRGLTRSWRERVFEELRQQGVELTFKQLTTDPFRGLIAKEVKIFDSRDRTHLLAEINEAVLTVDMSRLIRSNPFVSALELHDAHLSLPLPGEPGAERRLEVTQLHARLLFPSNQIRLVHGEARLLGCKVQAQGWIANPSKMKGGTERDGAAWIEGVRKALEKFEGIQFKGEAPSVSIQFSGDMNAPETLSASVKLKAQEILARGYAFDSATLSAAWRDGAVELESLTLADKEGKFHAVARWEPATQATEAQLESSLDIARIAAAFEQSEALAAFRFDGRPSVRMQVQRMPGEATPIQLTGFVEAKGFKWKEEHFDSLRLGFSWESGRWAVRDARVQHSSGYLEADALSVPNDFRLKFRNTLPPSLIASLFPSPNMESVNRWLQTRDPVRIEGEIRGTAPEIEACAAWGNVQCGRAIFRGVPIEQLETALSFKDAQLVIGPFFLKRTEGTAEGALTYDTAHNDLYLHQIEIRLNPLEAMKMIEPDWISDIAPYRFKGPPPRIVVDGRAAPHQPERIRLEVQVESPGGMDYDFAGKTLPFTQIGASLLFTPHHLKISKIAGTLLGGQTEGQADISLKEKSPVHTASLRITDMEFARLSHLYTGYDDSSGRLNATFQWKGWSDDGRRVDGTGALQIRDGNVFAIPFLGPLSTILGTVIPGFGYSTAHKAKANFSVKNGIFHTQDLRIEGLGFSVLGHGDLHFLDDKMKFYARVSAHGLPGMMFLPFSKLFEYCADGQLSKPVWKPRMIPKLPSALRQRPKTKPLFGDSQGSSERPQADQ